MKSVKHILALTLAMILVLASIPSAVFAEGEGAAVPKLSLSDESAKPGERVSVSVDLSDNPGLMEMLFTADYDSGKLSLIGVSSGGLSGWDTSGDSMLWLGNENTDFTGTIVKLNFLVLKTADPGKVPVTLICKPGNMGDHDENAYVPEISAGSITIKPAPESDDSDDDDSEAEIPLSQLEIPFEDVPRDAYYYIPVVWAYHHKPQITDGKSPTRFDPMGTCTRGEVVTFLWRAAGCPEPETKVNQFTDVNETDYFYKPVLWAVENGITEGTNAEKTHFSPWMTCSTAHIITFLYRSLGIGPDGWYQEAGDWANSISLLRDTGLLCDPFENCPRAAVVTFLYRWSLYH